MKTHTNNGATLTLERIETPPFQLPTPPPGMKWHREDGWTAKMLPPGTRPLVEGEVMHDGDQFGDGYALPQGSAPKQWSSFKGLRGTSVHTRTTRPLLFTHEGHEWTWHRPGDPMPCDGERNVIILQNGKQLGLSGTVVGKKWQWDEPVIGWRYADEEPDDSPQWIEWHGDECPLNDEEVEEWGIKFRNGHCLVGKMKRLPSFYDWRSSGVGGDIIAYRVLKWREKKQLPLGPEDVPAFSAIRRKPEQDNGQQWHWRCVSYVHGIGVQCANRGYEWGELQKDYQINRSIPLTGKWNPEAWEACEK